MGNISKRFQIKHFAYHDCPESASNCSSNFESLQSTDIPKRSTHVGEQAFQAAARCRIRPMQTPCACFCRRLLLRHRSSQRRRCTHCTAAASTSTRIIFYYRPTVRILGLTNLVYDLQAFCIVVHLWDFTNYFCRRN